MNDIILGVSPDKLRKQAGFVETDIEQMKRAAFNLAERFLMMRGYWKGDSSNHMDQEFDELKKEYERIFVELETYPVDLLKLAGLYDAVENENKVIAGSAPTSITMV